MLTLEQLESGRWVVSRDGTRLDGDHESAEAALAAGQAALIASAAATETAPHQPCTDCADCQDCRPLVAGAAPNVPDQPPADWFNDPGFTDDTTIPFYDYDDTGQRTSDTPYARGCPLTVTADGRVYGHLASWGVCHIGYPGECVQPPRSPSGYAYFRTGQVDCADGTQVPVGALTVDTGHAPTDLGYTAAAAAAHYDNTGTTAALVACGEDAYGIWVAGTVRPGATAEQVAALQKLSGDWRAVRGQLELVAALAVNTPGFPIPRYSLAASAASIQRTEADGQTVALIAAGSQSLAYVADHPWIRDMARLEQENAQLRSKVEQMWPVVMPMVASAARDRARQAAPTEKVA